MKMKYCTTTPELELAQPNDDENHLHNDSEVPVTS